jgi:small subunit ribosomal protein S2
MPQIPDLLTMLQSGVHFGHQQSKRNPKMKPFIFTAKNGVHVINLEETQVALQSALAFVTDVASKGGTILFISTKKQAQGIVRTAAERCGMPFITERWLGGTFTNFGTVNKLVQRLKELRTKKAAGELEKYTKKEQLDFDREADKLDQVVGGLVNMMKLPDAVFIIDMRKEKTALQEAIRKNIPVVALCDTNVDPTKILYPIPANDDAVKSISLITNLVVEAIEEGKAKQALAKPAAAPVATPVVAAQ